MATIKPRGGAYVVIYNYKGVDEKSIQQWETYKSELEAVQRKAHIDYLQKTKDCDELLRLASEYKQMHEAFFSKPPIRAMPIVQSEKKSNETKTFAEFAEKRLSVHAGKKQLSPYSYDSIANNLRTHILPYFGNMIVSAVTSEDVDAFLSHMRQKKCRGPKSRGKTPEEVPTLSSGTVKKNYDILAAAFPVAKEWGYTEKNPVTKAPGFKYKKRKFWTREQVRDALGRIDEKLLHLAVHTTFMCSLRAGETVGIELRSIDFTEGSLRIVQTLQRVSDKALTEIPQDEILRIFPKQKESSKSRLILKAPKTEGSERKLFLNDRLLAEIRSRIRQIEKEKEFFGDEYHDYGLLFAFPNGDPIETGQMEKRFRNWQRKNGIEPVIDVQGLRKSSSMYKLRLSGFNYQEVQGDTGHASPTVLMGHYNETLESERKQLAYKIRDDFYSEPGDAPADRGSADDRIESLLESAKADPLLFDRLMQTLQNMHTTQQMQRVRS
jgi:integrase